MGGRPLVVCLIGRPSHPHPPLPVRLLLPDRTLPYECLDTAREWPVRINVRPHARPEGGAGRRHRHPKRSLRGDPSVPYRPPSKRLAATSNSDPVIGWNRQFGDRLSVGALPHFGGFCLAGPPSDLSCTSGRGRECLRRLQGGHGRHAVTDAEAESQRPFGLGSGRFGSKKWQAHEEACAALEKAIAAIRAEPDAYNQAVLDLLVAQDDNVGGRRATTLPSPRTRASPLVVRITANRRHTVIQRPAVLSSSHSRGIALIREAQRRAPKSS